MNLVVTMIGLNSLGLKELCERHIQGMWFPQHAFPEQVAEMALDHFRRAVLAELEMLHVGVASEHESQVEI
jgi:hypothetical protein